MRESSDSEINDLLANTHRNATVNVFVHQRLAVVGPDGPCSNMAISVMACLKIATTVESVWNTFGSGSDSYSEEDSAIQHYNELGLQRLAGIFSKSPPSR